MNGNPITDEANPDASPGNMAHYWALGVTVLGAVMATGLSYIFITQFFVDVAGMPTWQAYGFGGVLEVCLIAAGLQARDRILAGADAGVLITLTWAFSGLSAALSASHEIVHRGADGTPVLDLSSGSPMTMTVRAVAPLVGAVMWHLLLIGEKHLVAGVPRGYRRHARLMHTYLFAREELRDLVESGAPDDLIATARDTLRVARRKVFRVVPVDRYQALLGDHLNALHADFEGSARVERMSEIRKAVPARKALPRTQGGTTRRIAGTTKVSTETVKVDAAEQPTASTPDAVDVEARDLRIASLYKEETPIAEIARDTGVSRPTVYAVLDKYNLRGTKADT